MLFFFSQTQTVNASDTDPGYVSSRINKKQLFYYLLKAYTVIALLAAQGHLRALIIIIINNNEL